MQATTVTQPATVAGADGCPAGWIVVTATMGSGSLTSPSARVVPDFASLLDATAACAAVAVDIPIGLSEDGRREADYAARRRIGPRRSSVFPAPARMLLATSTYAEANAQSRSALGRGLPAQAFNILAKIREADRCITPALQSRVIESHPEVSFWALAGDEPLLNPKRTPGGRSERLRLLDTVYGPAVHGLTPPRGAAWDDLYDACVLAWTASHVAAGAAVHLPPRPQRDARGLRMEIVY
jgi:predicted RNase H-like nuclease